MKNFGGILNTTLGHEGGYVNDPDDRGGETYKGIARVFHPDWSGWSIIDSYKDHPEFPQMLGEDKALQRQVSTFYQAEFWEPSQAEKLPGYLRGFYFDMCINHGQKTAVRILQKAINNEGYDIAVDGLIGPQTIRHAPYIELKEAVYERIYYYSEIIKNDSSQMKFRKGWYNRALEFLG